LIRHVIRSLAALAALALPAVAVAVVPAAGPVAADGTDPSWATCAQYTVPVTLTASDPTVYHVVGRLCTRDDALRGAKTVQLLVSGLTYDHNYWNPGYLPNTYSWVYDETSAGYSTFAIDRLGVGLSDHPPADELTVQNEAWQIEQIIQALRAGTVGGIAFQTVVGVGHSLGAGILQYEAGTATGAGNVPDYLVLSDFLNAINPAGVNQVNSSLYPAAQDPAFASAGLPSGYETTMPNTRGSDFYYAPGADPAMIASDESTKQTGSAAEFTAFSAARTSAVTHGIHVPTLLAVGQYDALDCNEAAGLSCANDAAVMARESGNFSPTACLKTYVQPNAGHDIDLHIGAASFFNRVSTWLDNYTINYVNQKDANGCAPVS
jgi:pimeloyl-ACP methyl ester carboxylesterase